MVGPTLEAPRLAWTPELADLPAPIRWGTPTLRVAEAPRLEVRPTEPSVTPPTPLPVAPTPVRRHRPRRAALLAAALPLLLVGAASAALLTSHPARPSLAARGSYADPAAGFSLAYPPSWRVARATPGTSVVFVVDGAVGRAGRTTVVVAVGMTRGPLPSVGDLRRSAFAALVGAHPAIQLARTRAATLAAGTAVTLQFSDPATIPSTSIEQVTGRTADDRPLTVTVTVPNPRGAPSGADLHAFLASIVS